MKPAEVNRIFSRYSEKCMRNSYDSVANIHIEGNGINTEFCMCAETGWYVKGDVLRLATPQGVEYIDCEAIQRIAVKIEKN